MRKDEQYKNEFSPEQRKWIDALKSGKYKKTIGTLMSLTKTNEPKGYCCLGVYCMISGQKWKVKTMFNKAYFGERQDTELNVTQQRRLKLNDQLGEFSHELRFKKNKKHYSIAGLAELNDSEYLKMSLADVGRWIEKNPHMVFKNFEEV